MQLLIHRFKLPLKHAFTISRRSFDQQENLIVELRDAHGLSGLGEATANPYYPNTGIAAMTQRLQELRPLIESYPLEKAADFWDFIQPHLVDFPFAHCALDEAAHDYCAQKAGLPLYQHWGLEKKEWPISSYTLGINPLEVMVQRMEEMPWPVYKIKLGRENDIALVEGLRKHTDAAFQVDANCAWTLEEALDKSQALAELGVIFIEQPLPAHDWADMKKLFALSPLPLIADEACRSAADLQRCPGHFHGINIKLMKCGGLTPARRMIQLAREKNLQVMVGCMTESTVGISALAHLLPLVDYVDMDGPLFLAQDTASGVKVSPQGAVLPKRNGTGAKLLQ